ncbi:oligosaccharide flippase family protein [Rhodopila sp.]|uniref:oligosaccharide flippase family protein n=1 Tax=Rhodopila sp. TaxID=2480087 RepID=UPI003D09EB9E
MSELHSPDSLLIRTARGAGWVVAWRLGMRLLGLCSTLMLVRLIRPADFGIIALASSFSQTIDGMMTLGTEEAVIRESSPGRKFYDTAFTLNLLRGLSVAALVAALAYPAAGFFADPRLGPVLLFVACLPLLDGLSNIGTVDFRRDLAFHKEFAIMVLPKLCGIVTAITAAVLLRSYVAMLLGMGVNQTMRVVMGYVMHPFRPGLSLKAWRGLAGYSLWTWLLSLAVLIRDRSDSLLLGRLMNTASVGFYSVGAEIAALPTTELIEPLGRAAFAGFSAGRQQKLAVGQTFLRLIGSAALVTLPAGVGLSLVGAPLVGLAFGPGWEQAVPVLRILALSFTVMVFGHLSLHLLSAHALLGRLVGITLAGAGVRLALLALLIPRFGLTGAAAAAAVAVVVEQALTLATAMRRFEVGATAMAQQVWRPMLAASAMAAVLVAYGSELSDRPGALGLVMAISAGAAIYAAVLLALWALARRPDGAEADVLRLLRRRAR